MSNAPILRSAALQRALVTQPVRPAPIASPTSFATTLAHAQSQSSKSSPSSSTSSSSVARQPVTTAVESAVAAQLGAPGDVPFQDLITAAAKKYGVRPALLAGLVKAESGFNPKAQSGVGAKGLTQLMDATARGLGVTDSFDPAQSLEGGARFLGGLLKQFKGDESMALAAYNAGPGAVQKYGGVPPYQETQRYVPKVLGFAAQFRRIWAD
jgi:soluble lytic murein transglycosylase-like protein